MDTYRYMFAARLATSVVIAAGLSMLFGWEKPVWAMFAVIYSGLGPEGESLHKGILRILATFMGGALSLIFTALFNDHRWAFGAAILIWVMLSVYMMQDNRRWYFWFHSALIIVLMPLYSAEIPARAFQVVMLRLEETTLGVVVYTIIATVVLPDRKRTAFIEELGKQVAAVKDAFDHLIDAYNGDVSNLKDGDLANKLRDESVALHTSFRIRIDVGIIESFDLVENRDAWRSAIDELDAVVRMQNRLRLSLNDIDPKALSSDLPDISLITAEIQRRLEQTVAVLQGADTVELPRPVVIPDIALPGDDRAVFEHGAMMACLETLNEIEQHSANLLIVTAEGRGLTGRIKRRKTVPRALPQTVIPDVAKLPPVLRIATIFITAFMMYIFIPDLPSGPQVILVCTIIGGFASAKPTTRTATILMLASCIIVVAGIIHMVVMPKLSSFLGLGTILFLYMFIGAALLYKPSMAALRFVALGIAAMVLQITNEQNYDFFYVVNLLISFQIPFILLWLTESFPTSFRPEHAFERLLRSYMKSFQHLIQELQYDRRTGRGKWWRRQIRGYHLRNIVQIPDRLDGWAAVMPAAAMNEKDRAQAQALSQALYDIAARMIDFNRHAETTYSPETIEQMRPAIRVWRDALEQLSGDFYNAPDRLPPAGQLSDLLESHLSKVSADTRQALSTQETDSMSLPGKTLLRELASYRGLSEALISATRHASALDWVKLREARF